MNNKGFAITTILYGTMILFLMLLLSMLGILSAYKDRLSMLIDSNNGARDIINSVRWSYMTEGEYVLNIKKSGIYKLEVWGAQGGTGVRNGVIEYGMLPGGYGGYSEGTIYLEKGKILHIVVGGKGSNGENTTSGGAGGFNGGGDGGEDYTDEYFEKTTGGRESGGGGGGATHIAFSSGELSSFEDKRTDILIVAGGGGGASFGGMGFSAVGYLDSNYSSEFFGKGDAGMTANAGTGGGGGGYVSGKAGYSPTKTDNNYFQGDAPGFGGTGYINMDKLNKGSMYIYTCPVTSADKLFLTYNTYGVILDYGKSCVDNNTNAKSVFQVSEKSNDAISKYVKEGHGAAIITFLGAEE